MLADGVEQHLFHPVHTGGLGKFGPYAGIFFRIFSFQKVMFILEIDFSGKLFRVVFAVEIIPVQCEKAGGAPLGIADDGNQSGDGL